MTIPKEELIDIINSEKCTAEPCSKCRVINCDTRKMAEALATPLISAGWVRKDMVELDEDGLCDILAKEIYDNEFYRMTKTQQEEVNKLAKNICSATDKILKWKER